jgi:hypothetical protein
LRRGWAADATEWRTFLWFPISVGFKIGFVSELKFFIPLVSYLHIPQIPQHRHQLKGPDAFVGVPSFLRLGRNMSGKYESTALS